MWLDLEYKIRTNNAFRHKLQQLSIKLQEHTSKAHESDKHARLKNDTLLQILKLCNFNLAPLLPYYFPKYIDNKPISLHDYPFAYSLFNIQIEGYTVIRGSRQIGKSLTESLLETMLLNLWRGLRIIYITPKMDQLKTYAQRLNETYHAYRFYQRHPNLKDNMFFKETLIKSWIKLAYVNTSATNIRGNSCDFVKHDEHQDFDNSLETEVSLIQDASPIPSTTYLGTSLTTDTALEDKYQASSQGIWIMKCPHCGKYNIPTEDGRVLDMIQPQGPSCIHCGGLLDVKAGRFFHLKQNALRAGRIGFHIPQLIVPGVVYNTARWGKIYERKQRNDPRKVLQEILGIPVEEGAREISEGHLKDICVLGDRKECEEKAMKRKYYKIISGCDWGGSDYNPATRTKESYTAHAVLGVTTDYKFDILHMRTYSGMAYERIADSIIGNHKRLKGNYIGTDFGVGAFYNNYLRKHLDPDQHLIFNYTGPKAAILNRPKGDHLHNQYSLNRTEAITSLYDAIKAGRLRCFKWEQAEELLLQFLNLIRAPDENVQTGVQGFKYRRHGSKPDDILHAINFAYVLGRIVIGEQLFEDAAVASELDKRLRGKASTRGTVMGKLPIVSG